MSEEQPNIPNIPTPRNTRGAAATAAAAAAGVTAQPLVAAETLPRLRSAIEAMSWDEAFEIIYSFIEAGPSRRRLKVVSSGGDLTEAVTTFRRIVVLLLDMSAEGDTTAELLLLYTPRVFALKGISMEAAMAALCDGQRPVPDLPERTPGMAWARAVEAAVDATRLRAALEKLDVGPATQPVSRVKEVLKDLHPTMQYSGERTRWPDDDSAPRFTPADMRRWAFASADASGGECGWTGHLVRHLLTPEGDLFRRFAAWAARPPATWNCVKTATIAVRVLTGWIIPRPGKAPRPIAAPSFVRRVGARALFKRIRPMAERFCAARGQLGLSGDAEILAYTAVANAALARGGSVAADDLDASYTRIQRQAVEAAVQALIASASLASAEDADAVKAIRIAMHDYYAAGDYDPANPTSLDITRVNFDVLEDLLEVHGLAQGCVMSGLYEAVVIAHHTPTSLSDKRFTVLGAHDDRLRVSDDGTLPLRPNVQSFGGRWSTTKATTLTAQAAKDKAITVWGRPVGCTSAWMADKLSEARGRMNRIRELANFSPRAAVKLIHSLGGPHGLVIHALRGVPLDRYDPDWVAQLEQDWADMVVDVLGGGDGAWLDPDFRRQQAFRPGSPFAGSAAAAEIASLEGLSLAAIGAKRLFGEERAVALAETLGGRFLREHRVPLTTAAIAAYVAETKESRARHRPARGLWQIALHTRGDLGRYIEDKRKGTDAWQEGELDRTLCVALAHTIGYPASWAAGIRRGRCDACETEVDPDLHHLNACKIAVISDRHNDLAGDLVGIAQEGGSQAALHDQRLPYLPNGSRPVDFVISGVGRKAWAVDLTIVIPSNLEAAARKKHTDYDRLLESTPFKCMPMALSLDGSVHHEADKILHHMRGRYARRARLLDGSSGTHAAHQVMVEVGLAFARRCTAAFVRWDARLKARALRRPRPQAGWQPSRRGAGTEARNASPQKRARAREHAQRLSPARHTFPEALRRETTRIPGRFDLSNVPVRVQGLTAGNSLGHADTRVCPAGPTLRVCQPGEGGLQGVGPAPPSESV